MGLLHGIGVFVGDEIAQSSNPAAHADGIITTMLRERVHWAAVQQDGTEAQKSSLQLLQKAAQDRGYGAVGTWAQGLAVSSELALAKGIFHIANVESKHEDEQWTDAALDELVRRFPNGMAGCIFQQGGFDYETPGNAASKESRDNARRWYGRGVVAIPEAIESENPGASISAMLFCCDQLGWARELVAPCVYLTRGYMAREYSDQIAETQGRWSFFRYGDADADDWATMATWPRPAGQAPPPPPLLTASISEFHNIVRDYAQRVRNKGVTLGPGAYPTLEDRLSKAYFDGVALSAPERARIVALYDELHLPQVP